MSRIIVKNLPKRITEGKLREMFQEKGIVTDLQMKFNKAGVFRGFAFIGYKTDEEAKAAKEYFNNTFVFTSKIKVEISTNLNDPNRKKGWKEFLKEKAEKAKELESKKESSIKKKSKKSEKDEIPEELMNDPKFKEFMAVHEDRMSKPLWADDIGGADDSDSDDESEPEEQFSDEEQNDEVKVKTDDVKDAKEKKKTEGNVPGKKDKVQDFLYTVKMRNLPYSIKIKEIKELFHPSKIIRLRIPRQHQGIAYVSFKTEKEMNKALIKHGGFLGGRRIDVVKFTKKEEITNEINNQQVGREEVNLDMLEETGRLYVRNLCFSATESELQEVFSKYGPLAEVYIPLNKLTKQGRGFAYVTFLFCDHAVKAYSELDGTMFQGRVLHLIPAEPRKEHEIDENETNYKKKKEAEMRALSGSSHNWNILFMGMNAVADVMAKKYSVEKSSLLSGNTKQSVAVRMALSETQLVLETRKFLIDRGVQLDAFSQPAAARSKTVIIVKHLPANAKEEELLEMFSKHGTVSRVILPPSGLMALIEFVDPTEAKEAFKKLAYRKFQYLPLYLEWAPIDGLKEPPPKSPDSEDKISENATDELLLKDGAMIAVNKSSEKEAEEQENSQISEEPQAGTTLYVKNLNFCTKEDDFKKFFEVCGPVISATISTKRDFKTGKTLSMGFGFIQYKSEKSAKEAVCRLQQSKLDGHALEIKFSNRTVTSSATTKRKKQTVKEQTSSKILVKNIPFEASQKEVKELFSTFGTLRSVRLPQKIGSQNEHRGFGFVEFVTEYSAKRAFEALCHSTHLLGRRLVLEWADAESQSVDEIRKKTIRDYTESGPKSKLTKTKFNQDVALASATSQSTED